MKTYRITVNGTAYDVAVEEINGGAAPSAAPAPASVPTPAAAPAPAASGTKGSVVVSAPMPGKILGVKTEIGKDVKKGDVLMVLEAM